MSNSGQFKAFEKHFLVPQGAALRRIAKNTRGDFSVGDVQNEAWIVARRIGDERGYPINFEDPNDHSLVLRWLHSELLKYRTLRFAGPSLDQQRSEVSAGADSRDWHEFLAADELNDPLEQLQRAAEVVSVTEFCERSFSEITVFVLMLARFDWEGREVAKAFAISLPTFRKWLERSFATMQAQPSLFDGISKIERDFMPQPRARVRRLPEQFMLFLPMQHDFAGPLIDAEAFN